jgi:two-component system sensor kinase FixL
LRYFCDTELARNFPHFKTRAAMSVSPIAPAIQSLLDVAVDAIIITDHAGHIGVFNSAAERLFGYGRLEIIDKHMAVLLPGSEMVVGLGREVDAWRKDGSVFPVQLSTGVIPHFDTPHFIAFLRDISAQRRTDALNHAEIARMAAGLAHNFNQPLTAITNYAIACERLLGRPAPDIPEIQDALRQISAQALRAGESVKRLQELLDSPKQAVVMPR